jgi:hypothetical protein
MATIRAKNSHIGVAHCVRRTELAQSNGTVATTGLVYSSVLSR